MKSEQVVIKNVEHITNEEISRAHTVRPGDSKTSKTSQKTQNRDKFEVENSKSLHEVKEKIATISESIENIKKKTEKSERQVDLMIEKLKQFLDSP